MFRQILVGVDGPSAGSDAVALAEALADGARAITITNIFILNNRSFSEQSLFKGVIIVAAVLLQQRLASRNSNA